ncbi:ATP-binding protein [Clostridium sp. DJ247]|uniref:sensor histidine kinase n=1 Tax=Clostridium sp. DJ247 TaxID=2726188 RepID=UPI001629BD28|nr:ATP-binding protein [Clostridium sp. DJ247]MBC2581311.1 PAS domain-containing protein [Clostridium sp. DJ247]
MNHSKYIIQGILLIFFITLVIFFQRPVYAESETQKNVLILQSKGNQNSFVDGTEAIGWENEIISSINSEFIKSKKNINVCIEYMDSNSNSLNDYSQQLYNLYKYKFQNTKFDAVITLDNNSFNFAFNFMIKYGNNLFPNTPVVFGGVTYLDKSILNGHPLFTGITKNPDIKNTLDVALKLHPNTKQIFVITDKTAEGITQKNLIKSLVPLYKNKVNFLFSDEGDILKLKKEINNLPKDTVIYFSADFKDNNGKPISRITASDMIFKDYPTPMYSRMYLDINKQSIGGVITNGSDYGKSIGNLTLRILSGEKASNIPVTEDTSHRYEFNYIQLKKFHIDLKALPKGSVIVNEPPKSFYIDKRQALYIFIIISSLAVLGAIFLYLNIYKRKLAERLLSDNESLLSTLINSTPDIIYFKNHEDKFLEVNDATLKLLNVRKKDYKNKYIHELTNVSLSSKKLLENFESNDKKAWEKGLIYRSEEVIWDKKEKINKIYDTLRIPLFNDDGTRKGLVLLGRDITEHKQNEENEKLIKDLRYYDKLKTNFFSNISHELRTPLNLIFSALQVIELKNGIAKAEDKSSEKYTAIMRQNCYRLLRIINNLIDITKIDAGHFSTHFQNNDIVNVVENIVQSVVDYVESKGISITFDTEIEEKVMAFDLDAMERIILNLLSNAIKFTPSGGSIEVKIYDKINSVVISVKDTGIGIPIEKQSSIFEKFVQVDKSLSRNREGSGIGLSLIKELIAIHNGTIGLESDIDKGSEFKVELPVNILPKDESNLELSTFESDTKVEKIKIEFSDIYN